MKKTILSLFCVLALCLGLLPVTALAAGEGAPDTLYVGSQALTNDEDSYWTTENGSLVKSSGTENWNVHYNPNTATLTLRDATIKTTHNNSRGAVIYAQSQTGSAVSLNIQLEGTNTIACDSAYYGIYVNAQMSETSYGTSASLTITGKGSLDASGSLYGIWVKSGSGSASLTINEASVNAKTTTGHGNYAGVCVQSGTKATNSPNLSLAVNGGSLTTSASEGNDGIQFYVGASGAASAATSLSVTNNAIVDAQNGGISASGVSVNPNVNIGSTGSTGGIVWNGAEGTVYGDVTLDEGLTIGADETLTIPESSSLDMNGNTITVESGGKLEGTPTGSGTVKVAPTITTESLSDGEAGTAYSQTLTASGDAPITWSLASGTLPDGLNLKDGTISGTPTAAGSSTFTVKAENSAGSATKQYTLNIKAVPVTSVKLDKDTLSLVVDGTATLQATIDPENATNKNPEMGKQR